MDCKKCQDCANHRQRMVICESDDGRACRDYKPAWSPAVARFTPKTPLPDGAVCVMLFDKCAADAYVARTGSLWYVYDDGKVLMSYSPVQTHIPPIILAIRAHGLPVWGEDLNRDGETSEEFWTDEECEKHYIYPARPLSAVTFLPYSRRVTLCCRWQGTRADGVTVSGWIVKPVVAEQPKPAPGQPCPSYGQPVPGAPPPPFKVGDILARGIYAHRVHEIWFDIGLWFFRSEPSGYAHCCSGWTRLPVAKPLPVEVRDSVRRVLLTSSAYNDYFVEACRYLADQHNIGG